jgi:hypothetical protein
MKPAAEEIVKQLLRCGVRVRVEGQRLALSGGKTGELSPELLREVTDCKSAVMCYVANAPLHPEELYVSADLEWWITQCPEATADKVEVDGKQFVRLTAAVVSWLKGKVLAAEQACDQGRLSLDGYEKILNAFTPIYAFAVESGVIS